MNTKELQSYLQICKEKSITKAAKTLYISPQGLSKIIKNLEKEIGVTLFTRGANGIEVTEFGKVLEEKSEKILLELDGMRLDIKSIKESIKGKINLISSYGILRYLTPDYIMEFRKQNPNINFSYEEYPDICVDTKIYNEEGELGFAIEPINNEKFDVMPLKVFKLKLLVNKKNPLSKKKSIRYEDIVNENLVIESSKFKLHDIFLKRCRSFGVEPSILFETNGFSLCYKLCKENKGVSVTIDFIAEDMINDEVVTIPFEDDKCEWVVSLIKKKGKESTKAMNVFVEFVKSWIENIENKNTLLNIK